MAHRRNRTAVFSVTLLALSGTAFVTGDYLREQSLHFGARAASQIAQAHSSGYALRTSPGSPHAARNVDDAEDARRIFDTVYSLVKQHFVDKLPSDRTMSQSAVRSMISSLNDPNCFFLEPEQFALFNSEARGRFSGIGASFLVRGQQHDGYTDYKITVVSAIPGSPAEKAGLKPGDIITHVDGKWVLGYDPYLKANLLAEKVRQRDNDSDSEAFRKEMDTARKRVQGGIGLLNAQLVLRGDIKTINRLKLSPERRTVTIERPGVKTPLVFDMTPQAIESPPLVSHILPDGAGYVRIPLFTEQTAEQFKQALTGLSRDRGLILDLRGNAGGLLESAMAVESMLSPGSAFGFEITTGGKQSPLKPTDAGSGVARPVVILVDRGTASVAEALAASLNDSGVGTIVGGRTFGDASVEMAYSLPDGSAFVLTTGKMLSPRRTDWAQAGLAPKVAVSPNTPEEQVMSVALTALHAHSQVAANRPQAAGG